MVSGILIAAASGPAWAAPLRSQASESVAVAGAATCSVNQSGAAEPVPARGAAAVRTMIGVARTMGVPIKGQIIAVMVMLQESSIRNLANDGTSPSLNWPSPGRAYWLSVAKLSLKYPHDKFGSLDGAHDTDSIGLFQQRPAWGWGDYGDSTGRTDPEGAVQRLLDPRWESMAFFGGTRSAAPNLGLLDVNGWQTMAPTDAAEAVQGSTQGDLYAKWEALATSYVQQNQDAPAIALPWAAYPAGGRGSMACTSVPVDPGLGEAGHNPFGTLDAAGAQDGQIRVAGWSFDPDAVNGVVEIRVSDTGPSGATRTIGGLANLPRDDVASFYNIVGKYGFDIVLPAAAVGAHSVCVSAVNIGRGSGDKDLGCRTIIILGPFSGCDGDPNNPTPSGVAAARTSSGVSAFVRGGDDAVWMTNPDSGEGYRSLGGSIMFGPAATSWAGSRLDVFVVGTDQALYHAAGTDGGAWSGWEGLGGRLTAQPAVISLAPGTLDVFGRGTDGQVWTIGWTGARWTSWTPAGGVLRSGLGGAADPDSARATVGARGPAGEVIVFRFGAGGPQGSAPLGTPACSGPAFATRSGDGDQVAVAFRDWSRGLTISGTPVGGVITSSPALIQDPAGPGVSALARGADNALWIYRGAPGSGGWSSLGGYLH